ncbi:MAG: Fic family protein [Phycisphaerae bacterium]|nr:Fic family protein [Phycisphaerae bacterium]
MLDDIQITPKILRFIAEIDEFKGAWRALGTLAPERLLALRRVASIESIGSSTRIEGAKLSDRQVERLLPHLSATSFASRDEQEVVGYARVMETVFESWESITLTENHIRQLHRDLLRHSEKDIRHRGQYKTAPNHVVAFAPDGHAVGVVFETATPFDTPRRMRELVEWTRQVLESREHHPLLVIAAFTVVFLAIHPFQDGNGRLSRILTTLLLLRAGYVYVPYSSLESVIERNKEAYYLALRRTQTTLANDRPDWGPWMAFFLEALRRQTVHLRQKIDRERLILESLPELAVTILDHARRHGRVGMAEMIRQTKASRNTLKLHFRRLLAGGKLTKHGAGRGVWYSLR